MNPSRFSQAALSFWALTLLSEFLFWLWLVAELAYDKFATTSAVNFLPYLIPTIWPLAPLVLSVLWATLILVVFNSRGWRWVPGLRALQRFCGWGSLALVLIYVLGWVPLVWLGSGHV